jgi:methyl-accepting chemotaxis protein
VAEEVGNLAQMSGNAAKEITSLLEGSIIKVETMVAETKNRVEKLVEIGKQKVDTGIKTAKSCSDVLEEIVASVSQVNQMVEEISTASNEQAQGVSEITKAMNQLDQVTQQNTSAATVASDTALEVKTKAEVFNEAVLELTGVVLGKASATKVGLKPSPTAKTDNVVSISSYKKATATPVSEKKAVGDGVTPSSNDSRFEDV